MDERLLASARKGHRRSGKKDLIDYLEGKHLTRNQAIRAKCYDCNGMGESDICDSDGCSLFPFSPYAPHRPKGRLTAEVPVLRATGENTANLQAVGEAERSI